MNESTDLAAAFTDPDDLDNNRSANPRFQDVLNAGMSRRNLLRGSAGGALAAMFAPLALSGCGGGDNPAPAPAPVSPAPTETLLGFTAVAKTLADTNTVPAG